MKDKFRNKREGALEGANRVAGIAFTRESGSRKGAAFVAPLTASNAPLRSLVGLQPGNPLGHAAHEIGPAAKTTIM